MSAFTERTAIETGFAEVYEARLTPRLTTLEKERRSILSRAKLHAALAIVVGLGVGALLVTFGPGWGTAKDVLIWIGIPLVLGAVGAFLLWRRQAATWSGAAADAIMPEICAFLGDLSHDREAPKGFKLEQVRKLGVIPPFTHSELGDRLEGTRHDSPFEIVEAKLVSKETKRRTDSDDDDEKREKKTVFEGLVLRVGVPEPVPSRILIARDYGMGNKVFEVLGIDEGRKMPKVDTGHAEFERSFEVYSEDAEAARKVLTPGFLDSFTAIAEAEGGPRGAEDVQAGFEDANFFMALKRKEDFLKMGSLTTPADEVEEALHGVFDDIAMAYRIIDRLHGEAPA